MHMGMRVAPAIHVEDDGPGNKRKWVVGVVGGACSVGSVGAQLLAIVDDTRQVRSLRRGRAMRPSSVGAKGRLARVGS